MAAARNVSPNMTTQTAPAIRPERMFLRASFRSMIGFSERPLVKTASSYNFTSATIAPNNSAR